MDFATSNLRGAKSSCTSPGARVDRQLPVRAARRHGVQPDDDVLRRQPRHGPVRGPGGRRRPGRPPRPHRGGLHRARSSSGPLISRAAPPAGSGCAARRARRSRDDELTVVEEARRRARRRRRRPGVPVAITSPGSRVMTADTYDTSAARRTTGRRCERPAPTSPSTVHVMRWSGPGRAPGSSGVTSHGPSGVDDSNVLPCRNCVVRCCQSRTDTSLMIE